MKRFFILILCFAMLLSLTACGGKTDSADTNWSSGMTRKTR